MELVLGERFDASSFRSLEFRVGEVVLYKIWHCKDAIIEGPRIAYARNDSLDVTFDYDGAQCGYYNVNIRTVGARFTLREEEGVRAQRRSEASCRVISCETLDADAFLTKFMACVFRGQAALGG